MDNSTDIESLSFDYSVPSDILNLIYEYADTLKKYKTQKSIINDIHNTVKSINAIAIQIELFSNSTITESDGTISLCLDKRQYTDINIKQEILSHLDKEDFISLRNTILKALLQQYENRTMHLLKLSELLEDNESKEN